jgi:DNA-binding NarL/FixJ family response regulator
MAEIRVLIVDDMERVRQDLRTFLTLAGDIMIVGEAINGQDAIHLADTLCPQVILMDLEMPVQDGYGATRQIKASQPSCRIIALTIHDGDTEKEKALQAGADDFITKGPSLDRLLEAIHKISTIRQMPLKGE